MSEQNKQLVITFLEAMGKGDTATAGTCLHPEAVTIAKGFGKCSGIRHIDRILGTIEAFRDLIPDGLKVTIHSLLSEDDQVAVEFEGDAVLYNGTPYCNQYCMIFTVEEGKIKQVNEYFCTILADETLYPLIAPAEQPVAAP